ncbi:MAG: dipeptidase [Terriglobales bacterium]
MRKRLLLALRLAVAITVLGFFFVLPAQVEQRYNKTRSSGRVAISQRARELHSQLFIADLHADSLLWDRNLLKRSKRGHVDLPRLEAGNVALQGFTVVTKVPFATGTLKGTDQITPLIIAGRWPPRTWNNLTERALYQAHKLRELEASAKPRLLIVDSRQALDLLVASRTDKLTVVGAYLGLEGAHALEGDLKNLDKLYDAGFRTIGLAHFFDNEFAGSAHGASKGGLTPLGRELVRVVEHKKMIIDLAHASPQTIREVIAMSTRPVIVSHTGVKGTCNNERNLSDDEVKAIAAKGGLIGIGYWSTAVCGPDARSVARAIRYTVGIAGAEHVALGSDFDGAVTAPFDTSELIQITQALLDAGLSDDQIRKVMGGNVLEFMRKNLPAKR